MLARKPGILLVLLLLALALPFSSAMQDEKTLTIGINAEIASLDPHHVPGAIVGNRIYNTIFDSLTRTDATGNVVPMLATEWESVDDTTWVFTLREGVVFQNGETMTAEDAAYSLNRLLFSDEESFIRGTFLPYIEAVEATGDLELTVTTPAVDPLLPLRLTSPNAAIMPQAYVEEAGFDAVQTQPTGAGPYRVVDYIPGDRLVLEAHEDYWMGKPDADRVTFRLIPETSTRVSALRTGEIDFATTLSPDVISQIEDDPNLNLDTAPVFNFMLIYFNTNEGFITSDPLIRRALSLAIDRELIAEALWDSQVRVMNDYFLPGEFAFDEDRPNFAYDPEEAMRLLDEAGYNGEPVAFTPPNAYYTNGQLVTDVINEMWQAVGVNVDYEPLDTAAWADRSLSGQNVATLQSFGTAGDPATSSIVQTWDSWMGQYFQPSDEFRALAAEAGASLDADLRLTNYRQITTMLDEIVPFAPLYQSVEFYGVRDGIEWQPHPEFYIDLRPDVFSID
jgi:peptide/nickel transport system substrate-binding protein